MRTLFEDTNEREVREDDKSGRGLSITMTVLALAIVVGAFFTYRWISKVKQSRVPVMATLDDNRQVSQAVFRFNQAVKNGNWAEAEKMLSTEAQKRLAEEKKTLRESLLAARKGKSDKVIEALPIPTEFAATTPNTKRVDCMYVFEDNEQLSVPLTFVVENNQLVVNSW